MVLVRWLVASRSAGRNGERHQEVLSRFGKLRQDAIPSLPDASPPVPNDMAFRIERAKLLEQARLERRWTKKQLAEKAGYDEKTLYNLLSGGDVHDKTIHDFCQALGIDRPEPVSKKIEIAADQLGGYSRSIYDEYEGHYRIYRPSFSDPDRIYRYAMRIDWDETHSHFRFLTSYKRDPREATGAKTHSGPVSISAVTNLVHFVVTFRGSVRLVTVTKLRSADGVMRGSMSTHFEDLNFFRPTLTPIVIQKVAGSGEPFDVVDAIKMLDEQDEDRAFAREQIRLTERSVLNLCFQAQR
jgi:transcriptional regulator with XRE-family HTH domain